jgi:hypothetical protein
MPAGTVTAISTLQVVRFSEDDVALRREIVIFFIKLIGKRHNDLTLVQNYQNRGNNPVRGQTMKGGFKTVRSKRSRKVISGIPGNSKISLLSG